MAQTMRQVTREISLQISTPATATKKQVRHRISEVGIIPAICVASEEDALFAAEALTEAGIPIIEVSVTFPGAFHFVSHLAERLPDMIVGAGGILDAETARRCLDRGASFLMTDGFVPEVLELGNQEEITVASGAMTPTEVIAAWRAGSDFVKVFPCDAVGGASYIRSLKTALPQIRLIAAGGINDRTASSFITAGASALCVGNDLIPADAIRLRQAHRIQELGRRFLHSVDSGRY